MELKADQWRIIQHGRLEEVRNTVRCHNGFIRFGIIFTHVPNIPNVGRWARTKTSLSKARALYNVNDDNRQHHATTRDGVENIGYWLPPPTRLFYHLLDDYPSRVSNLSCLPNIIKVCHVRTCLRCKDALACCTHQTIAFLLYKIMMIIRPPRRRWESKILRKAKALLCPSI